MSADEEAVYNFITELFTTRQSGDATFAAVKNVAGERGVVDLIVSAGYYQVVSMFMNTDRLPVNANQQPELKYLAKPLSLNRICRSRSRSAVEGELHRICW
jgi:hypothetical protein